MVLDITASTVNDALTGFVYAVTSLPENQKTPTSSRNGPVVQYPVPVVTTYLRPEHHVLFSKERHANPYFHFMEMLWMLGGRRDVLWPSIFNTQIAKYSDDGRMFHGAYGHRWRHFFGRDQLACVASELIMNPESRRAVLAMWSPEYDLLTDGLDLPCNTHIYFQINPQSGALDMTVCNRSNDAIWGTYGANVVHMSMLLMFMAHWIQVPVGVYAQFSMNTHVYVERYPLESLKKIAIDTDANRHTSDRLFNDSNPKDCTIFNVEMEDWEFDLNQFLAENHENGTFHDPFFQYTAVPMYLSWMNRATPDGMQLAKTIRHPLWREACVQYLERRAELMENSK